MEDRANDGAVPKSGVMEPAASSSYAPKAELDETSAWVLDAVAEISDALMVIDESARLVYRNPAAERLVGIRSLAPDPAKWPEIHGIFEPDEKTFFKFDDLPLMNALRGEDVRDVALFVRNARVPAGVHILVSANTLRDKKGAIRGAACVFRDITLLRQHEANLRESARQKQAILDNIPEMAWLKDDRGRFLLVNQRLAEASNKTPDEIVGLTDLDLWPRELAERYRADDEEIMRSGLHKRVEEHFVDKRTHKLIWLETIKTRIVDDAGKVIGTTGIAHDITDRKHDEEVMRTTKDELERRVLERTTELAEAQENLVRQERLAILGQLAGGVAHQIRNPLAAIMNATYVLKRHLSPDQHQNVDDAIRIIHDEVRHANIIITGLLDYARVRTPDRHPASLVDLLERILTSEWIPQSIRIERSLPAHHRVVLDVDSDQLQGAISNLVRNAIDAMPEGGTLGVALDVLRPSEEILITISDTGTGISPQVRTHLFEPLHSTKPMGIGLGLVTARRFIEAHSGSIASVDVPKGARFEIRLPLHTRHNANA